MANVHHRNASPEQSATPPRSGSEKVDLIAITLDDAGIIRDCSQACEPLLGYRPSELVGSHISRLLPQLPEQGLVQEGRINTRVAYLCHCGIAFQARHRDGRPLASEVFINRLDAHNVVVLVRVLEAPRAVGLNRPIH